MSDFDQRLELIMHQLLLLKQQVGASFAQVGLPNSQYQMLRVIGNSEGVHPTQLARAFAVSLSAVTATITRMEKDGLVCRREDRTNRRQIIIEITAKGAALLQQVRSERRKILRDLFARFSPEELDDFLHLIAKLNHR